MHGVKKARCEGNCNDQFPFYYNYIITATGRVCQSCQEALDAFGTLWNDGRLYMHTR